MPELTNVSVTLLKMFVKLTTE